MIRHRRLGTYDAEGPETITYDIRPHFLECVFDDQSRKYSAVQTVGEVEADGGLGVR